MKTEKFYTPRQFEILMYIYSNGKKDVTMSMRSVRQNKNFFQRVAQLEDDGHITVIRSCGFASLYTLTESGIKICESYKIVKIPGFISPIEKTDPDLMKHQLDTILDEYDYQKQQMKNM